MYEVLEVPERHQLEQLGTKEKFWFYDDGNDKRLCKIGRSETGENWAEKVAYELATLLGVPCAEYHLAMWRGRQAVVSIPFLSESERLVHGNEILGRVHHNSYHATDAVRLKQYKLKTVIALFQKHLGGISLPEGYTDNDIQEPVELFILYLMFDCWIGNQDRHDQNWGLVLGKPQDATAISMAPSFDHASSMACRLFDPERHKRLHTTDKGYSIETYLGRARTPFFGNDGSRQLKTLECFNLSVELAKKQKDLGKWVAKLESIDKADVEQVLAKVPPEFGMSDIAVEFTASYLEANKGRLLGVML